jgi:hypothetical protein
MSKIKAKPKPKTRAAVKSIDDKYYGPEPIVVSNEDQYWSALNWYNYMFEVDKAREWLLEYMKQNKLPKNQMSAVRRVSKHKIPTTIGWQARIMTNGNTLSESAMSFFENRLNSVIAAGELVEEPTTTEKPVVDIQARVRDKANFIITNLEEELDLVMDGKEFSMYNFCQANELNPQILNVITNYYLPQYEELKSADDQVKEAFGKRQKFWFNFWSNFFSDIDRFLNNKKAVKIRKPREKKAKSAIDIVKNLKFKKEDASLKIVSVHPAEIVGCSQLWVYNTKYKKLTRYDASGPAGLQVKGTTLIGFDAEVSIGKSLRKPEQTIKQLLEAGKVGLRKLMDDLKTVASTPNGRINEECILLRVVK